MDVTLVGNEPHQGCTVLPGHLKHCLFARRIPESNACHEFGNELVAGDLIGP